MDNEILEPYNSEVYKDVMTHFNKGYNKAFIVEEEGMGLPLVINAILNGFKNTLVVELDLHAWISHRYKATVTTHPIMFSIDYISKEKFGNIKDLNTLGKFVYKRNYDFIVMADAHHIVRNEDYEKIFNDVVNWLIDANPGVKVLITSILPIRFLENKIKKTCSLFKEHHIHKSFEFKDYFEWIFNNPQQALLKCKKACWVNFKDYNMPECWGKTIQRNPDLKFKGLLNQYYIGGFQRYKGFANPVYKIQYPSKKGVITFVHDKFKNVVNNKDEGWKNFNSIYFCKAEDILIEFDINEKTYTDIEVEIIVAKEEIKKEKQKDWEEKLAREKQIEKDKIRRKLLEKQRKKLLEKEALDELIKEGLMFPDAEKRPHIPREVVDAVWRRDKGRCVYCGSDKELQLDHIIPFSKGGATTFENLQLLCRTCNNKKSNNIG